MLKFSLIFTVLFAIASCIAARPSSEDAEDVLTGNLAKGKPTLQSSTAHGGAASRAVDGVKKTHYFDDSCTHTGSDALPWWRVDLGSSHEIKKVRLTNRGDCCWDRLRNIEIIVSNVDQPNVDSVSYDHNEQCTYHAGAYEQSGRTEELVCSNVVQGRYVYVVKKTAGYLTLCEVEVFGIKADDTWHELTGNIAEGKETKQSSTSSGGVSSRAVDGKSLTDYFAGSCTHTLSENKPWWRVDLGSAHAVVKVIITNRGDCCSYRLSHVAIRVGDVDSKPYSNALCTYFSGTVGNGAEKIFECPSPKVGRYVFVVLRVHEPLTLCEVVVYAIKQGNNGNLK